MRVRWTVPFLERILRPRPFVFLCSVHFLRTVVTPQSIGANRAEGSIFCQLSP